MVSVSAETLPSAGVSYFAVFFLIQLFLSLSVCRNKVQHEYPTVHLGESSGCGLLSEMLSNILSKPVSYSAAVLSPKDSSTSESSRRLRAAGLTAFDRLLCACRSKNIKICFFYFNTK